MKLSENSTLQLNIVRINRKSAIRWCTLVTKYPNNNVYVYLEAGDHGLSSRKYL